MFQSSVELSRSVEAADASSMTTARTGTDDRKRTKLSPSNDDRQLPQPSWRRRGVVTAVRKYRGHVDGVWDVAVTSFPVADVVDGEESIGRVRVVGAASAGRYKRIT